MISKNMKRFLMLKKGDTAPAFKLSDQNGKIVNLSGFIGKKVLVSFYGKALTSG